MVVVVMVMAGCLCRWWRQMRHTDALSTTEVVINEHCRHPEQTRQMLDVPLNQTDLELKKAWQDLHWDLSACQALRDGGVWLHWTGEDMHGVESKDATSDAKVHAGR